MDLPLYHEFYDRLTGAPWTAQKLPESRRFEVIGGYACGCMAVGETVVSGLPEFDAKVIADAPEAYALLLRVGRWLETNPADPKGQALLAEIRETFAALMG
jgi:hypothetical protein